MPSFQILGQDVQRLPVNLPFGAQVVVFAYPSQSGLVVVLDGRIANQMAWLQALARVKVVVELLDNGISASSLGPRTPSTTTSPTCTRTGAPRFKPPTRSGGFSSTSGEYVIYEGQQAPVTVVVLLEEPIYTYDSTQVNLGNFWSAADLAFWDVVGAATFALAVNTGYAGDPMPQVLYDAVLTILWGTLHFTCSYGSDGQLPRNDFTPFAIQFVGAGVRAARAPRQGVQRSPAPRSCRSPRRRRGPWRARSQGARGAAIGA